MWKGMCKKIQVWISCLWFVSRPAKFGCFFWKIFVDLFWKSFWGRNNSLDPPFLTIFNMVWKNQESCESWLVEFWVIRRLKMQANFYQQFIFVFLSCHYGFTNYFEVLFFFLIPYLEKFQPVKYYFSRMSTSRNIKL